MYNKTDIIKILSSIENKEALVLLHGASMVMLGVKESTRDIDLHLNNPELFKDMVWHESVDLGIGEPRHSVPNTVLVDGFRCQALEDIVIEKKRWGRQKDFIAIEQIKNFLNN